MKLGAWNYWDVLDTHYIGGGGRSMYTPEESVVKTIKGSREMMRHYGRELPTIWDGESGYPLASRNYDHRPVSPQELLRRIREALDG